MKRGMGYLGILITVQKAERMCFQKRVFKTKNDARDFAARGRKMGNASTDPYQCPLCRRWHLTSLDKAASAASRKRNWSTPK